MSELGYNKPLFILAFDHRASFAKKILGIQGAPNSEQAYKITQFKQLIFDGLLAATRAGVPKSVAALLVDEQYGDVVIRDASIAGITTCVATEKSGQDEFEFEYGQEYPIHILKYHPAFAKALVRYNPENDTEMNHRQCVKLKELAEFCHRNSMKFLIEPLVAATSDQLQKVKGDFGRFDRELRPGLTIAMIRQMQLEGVDPDVWKIEGFEDTSHYQSAVAQARYGPGRENVSVVVLGRAAETQQVEAWLRAARGVAGLIGFAIGRSIFWHPLTGFRDGRLKRDEAVAAIAGNYKHFYEIFTKG